MLAGPALNPLDRATDPWGLAVPAERGRRQQRGCQGEGMPPGGGVGGHLTMSVWGGGGGPLRILPGQSGWSPRNCFSWGWSLVVLSFGSFEISEESGLGTGLALPPSTPPCRGSLFPAPPSPPPPPPRPCTYRDAQRQGKEGKEVSLCRLRWGKVAAPPW